MYKRAFLHFLQSHWGIIAIGICAIFLYTFRLNSIPFAFHGDEGETATQAVRVIHAGFPVIGVGWFDLPIASFIPHALTILLFGATKAGDRMGSVIFSLALIPLYYLLLLRIYNKTTSLIATVLLASSHLWIALSRLGITYVQATFLLLSCLFFLDVGLRKKHPNFVAITVAGICCGLCFYSYYAARITPFIAVPFFFLFLKKETLVSWLIGLFLFMCAAGAIFLPQGLYYLNHPASFSSRTNTVYIFSPTGRAWTKYEYQGKTDAQILESQFLRSINPFAGDNSGQYGYKGQLLDYVTITLFFLGILTVMYKRNLFSLFLFYWFFLTIVIGQTLTTVPSPVFLPRLVVGLPALFALCATGLVSVVTYVKRLAGKAHWLPMTVSGIILLIIISINIYTYFILYPSQQLAHIAGDPNALAATKISSYLNSKPEFQSIFLTAPFLNIPYGPFDYLASQRSKVIVDNASEYPIPQFLTKTIFVLYPQYANRLQDIETAYPRGKLTTVKSITGDVEYYLFVVN
ncbi:MAG: glycosyltransferase family 39 protein [Patescibacteria group bacterium]|nr:glycosyltransferase family 39 protein [Patescibacteria group bacterium]